MKNQTQPKVFISYSWSSEAHKKRVQEVADELLVDYGVRVIIDIYDLTAGHDKYHFMEQMVTDPSITHVLVMCDKTYVEKANARKAGVGTESQIISGEIYGKVHQSKFIPIVFEYGDDNEPLLPAFMEKLIYIDFSSSEAKDKNWESLIRSLYGQPQHVKPEMGKAPDYITHEKPVPHGENSETVKIREQFNLLKKAIPYNNKNSICDYRSQFIESCINYADTFRVREDPHVESMGQKVLEDCAKLKAIRDHLCDWVLLEGTIGDPKLSDKITDLLEKLSNLKVHPTELSSSTRFEASAVFVYEMFLYIIAALLKCHAFSVLRNVYRHDYYVPHESPVYKGESAWRKFDYFHVFCDSDSRYNKNLGCYYERLKNDLKTALGENH